MKKRLSPLFILSFVVFVFAFLVACNGGSNPTSTAPAQTTTTAPATTTPAQTTTTPAQTTTTDPATTTAAEKTFDEVMATLDFNDVTVEYDGEAHNIAYEGQLPDGYTYTIIPNKKNTEPGVYSYNMRVTYNGETKVKTAKLTINKIKPHYTGATEFTIYLNDPSTQANFTFDVEGLELVDDLYFTEAGEYVKTLETKENKSYAPIDPVSITFHVFDNICGLSFESTKVVLTNDVTEASIVATNVENLPAGYTVSYENNVQTEQGVYQAKALVKNANDEVVETYRAILTVDYEDNPDFAEYEKQLLLDYIEDDQLAINIFFVDYESYGIEHGDASWYSYTTLNDYTDDDYNHDLGEARKMRQDLEAFKSQHLSYNQINTYNRADEFVSFYEDLLANKKNLIMRLNYVDEYGGNCADVPTDVEAYAFRTLQDIDDCLLLINSCYDAFDTYYTYIVDRESFGYGLSSYTLNGFIKYLDGVVDSFDKSKDGYYLNNIIKNKLDEAQLTLKFTDEVKTNYINQFSEALNSKEEGSKSLYLAHKDLSAKVKAYLEAAEGEGGYLASEEYTGTYLGEYEGGSELYYAMLKNRLGLGDLLPQSYQTELDKYADGYYELYKYYSQKLAKDSTANSIYGNNNTKYINYETVYDIIDYLKEFATTLVYDLDSTPTIDVAYMDPTTTANTTTVAYYMKSPLDSREAEYIHLNARALGTRTYDTATTLAHEGYPGHLYAYVLSKENENLSDFVRINTCTGHGEGWAKYVEAALSEYFIAEHNYDESWDTAMHYAIFYDLFIFSFYARVDFGIGYQGWGVKEVGNLLSKYGLNSGAAESFFQTLNEIPTQYAPYGYGFAVFYSLHEQARDVLGHWYDEKEFNQVLLGNGWIGLTALKAQVNAYLNNKCFELGLSQ